MLGFIVSTGAPVESVVTELPAGGVLVLQAFSMRVIPVIKAGNNLYMIVVFWMKRLFKQIVFFNVLKNIKTINKKYY